MRFPELWWPDCGSLFLSLPYSFFSVAEDDSEKYFRSWVNFGPFTVIGELWFRAFRLAHLAPAERGIRRL